MYIVDGFGRATVITMPVELFQTVRAKSIVVIITIVKQIDLKLQRLTQKQNTKCSQGRIAGAIRFDPCVVYSHICVCVIAIVHHDSIIVSVFIKLLAFLNAIFFFSSFPLSLQYYYSTI